MYTKEMFGLSKTDLPGELCQGHIVTYQWFLDYCQLNTVKFYVDARQWQKWQQCSLCDVVLCLALNGSTTGLSSQGAKHNNSFITGPVIKELFWKEAVLQVHKGVKFCNENVISVKGPVVFSEAHKLYSGYSAMTRDHLATDTDRFIMVILRVSCSNFH